MIEWVSLSQGGKATGGRSIDQNLTTDFSKHIAAGGECDPRRRKPAALPALAGAVDASGWCAMDPVTFESRLVPNVHVIGDACIAGGMPKSACAANAQAKACAGAMATLLAGKPPGAAETDQHLLQVWPRRTTGFRWRASYQPKNGLLADVEGAGGTSPVDAPRDFRAREAVYAQSWFDTITAEVFG